MCACLIVLATSYCLLMNDGCCDIGWSFWCIYVSVCVSVRSQINIHLNALLKHIWQFFVITSSEIRLGPLLSFGNNKVKYLQFVWIAVCLWLTKLLQKIPMYNYYVCIEEISSESIPLTCSHCEGLFPFHRQTISCTNLNSISLVGDRIVWFMWIHKYGSEFVFL